MVLKGFVLAGGLGTRLRPLTLSYPKHLIPLLGKAMIEYPISSLINAGVKDIGVLVGYLGGLIKKYLGDGSRHGARFTYVVQERRLGIAHAIYLGIAQGFIDGPFVAYLGDNIFADSLGSYVDSFLENESDVHLILHRVDNPNRFGVAVIKDNRIVRLVEKPQRRISDLAVTGIYFFRDPDLVERAFRALRPSRRGEYEVTELVQWFIDNGYKVTYDLTLGWWRDVGTPESLLDTIFLLLSKVEPRVRGEIEGEISENVVVEEGATVKGKVLGPAYIGKNAFIGKGAVIDRYVSVESGAEIVSGTISRSLVLSEVHIDIGRSKLVDSLIGGKSMVKLRGYYNKVRLIVSDYSRIEA